MSVPSEAERFSTNSNDLSNLVHELTSKCWDSGHKEVQPMLINLAQSYLNSLDKTVLMETFIEHSNNFWDEILAKSEIFFIKHSKEIFGKLPIDSGNIDAFKMLFTAQDKNGDFLIIQDDRDAVWEMFGTLVKICIKHIHKKRVCILEEDKETGKMRPRYKFNFFPDIKVREHAKKWKIELEIPRA